MLDMGFLDDIKEIFTHLPQERQTLLFSATMSSQIKALARKILKEPKMVSITGKTVTGENIKQLFYVVDEYERDDALVRLLDYKNPSKSIIFCRMRKEVDRLRDFLNAQGYSCKGLHGDMDQRQRESVIRDFKSNRLDILIATDVAARGLDVNDVSHVFNYHIPFDPQSYVHRIGRTGRAGKSGRAITLASTEEFRELQRIQKEVGAEMRLATIQGGSGLDETSLEYLAEQIRDMAIHNEAQNMIEYLGNIDRELLLEKLISCFIEKEQQNIGSQIGFDQHTVDAMLQEYSSEQKSTKNNHRRRKRR